MSEVDQREAIGATSRQYRRGALMGMTMAEVFMLISFALLLLLAAWKVQADQELARYRQIETLTPGQVRAVAEMADAGRLQEAWRLSMSDKFASLSLLDREGADLSRLLNFANDKESWRLIDKDELRRILDGAQELPEDLQRDLADLVEIEDPRRLLRLLELTRRAPEDQTMRERLAGIGAQLDSVREAEADLVDDLRRTLGDIVEEVGGHIDDSGAVVLQDSILFDVGSAQLTPRMRAFLDQMCVPWMRVMMRSDLAVAGAQIEGHASSEWRTETTVRDAYLNNLDLSQRRSAAVLRECLEIVSDDDVEVEGWARDHLRAVGFSSARPVVDDQGAEIPEQSRRVVFSLDLDQESVIEELEGEVRQSLP